MTQTLTTERLREIASGNAFTCTQDDESVAMAAELLANRGAQPVGFYTTVSGRGGVVWHNGAPEDDTAIYTAPPVAATTIGNITDLPNGAGCMWQPCDAKANHILLYTAPPAPAVPEAAKVGEMPFLGRGEPDYVRGWNDCRAAMLAQPQSEPQNIPNNIPYGLAAAVNRLLDCDGTRGHFSAIRCSDAREEVEQLLAQPVSQRYKLPEGFKLMPIEMTDEIAEAIAIEARCCGGIALCIYEAALAAAPEGGNG